MPRKAAVVQNESDGDADDFDLPDSPDASSPSTKKKKKSAPKPKPTKQGTSRAKSGDKRPTSSQANEDKAASDDGEMDLGEEEFAAQYEVEDLLKMTIPPPPKPIMESNGTGERLMIKKIVAINFKSYYGRQEIGPFHQNFTSIVGPNGSGKSNVIDAMLFVFGYKSRKIRSKKLSVLIHNSSRHPNIDSCTVEVHFHKIVDVEPFEEHRYKIVNDSEYVVTRTAFKNNSSKYYLNGHHTTFKHIGARLRQDGIDLKHNRFLILQGEVEQISLMKPKGVGPNDEGMLEYLEDIIGSSRFKIPIEKFTEKMQQLTLERSQQTTKKNAAEKAKKDLDEPVKEVLRYIRMENDVILKKQKIYTFDKLKYEDRIPEAQAKADEVQKEIDEVKEKKKQILEERDSKAKEEKNLEKEKDDKTKERDTVKKQLNSLEAKEAKRKNDLERARADLKKSEDALSKENKKKKDLENAPAKSEKKIEELEKEVVELEEKQKVNQEEEEKNRPEYEKKTEKLREERDTIGKELLDKDKTARDASKNLMVAQSDKANLLSAADKEKNRLEELENKLQEIEEEIDQYQKKKKIAEDGLPKYEDNLQKARQELNDSKKAMDDVNNEIDQIHQKIHDADDALRNLTQGNAVEKLLKKMNSDGDVEYFGRLGDLVSTTQEFDKAISNATNWDVYVVATQAHGKKVITAIQQQKLPRTNLITMDAVRDFGANYYQSANDQVAPRLFDLLKISDPKFNKVVYQSLREMRLCDNLNAANQIKSSNPNTYRDLIFVSREGNMIYPNSKIVGGGKPVTNKVGHRSVDNRSEADLKKIVNELKAEEADKRREIDAIKNKIRQLDGSIHNLTRDIDKLTNDLKMAEDRLRIAESSRQNMQKRVEEQRKKVGEVEVDQKELDEKNRQIADLEKVRDDKAAIYEEANDRFKKVEEQIKKIYDSLVGNFKVAKEAAIEELKTKKKEIAKENAAIESSSRNLQKCEKRIEQLQGEIEKAQEAIELLDKVQKDDGEGDELKEKIEQIEKEIKEIDGKIKQLRSTGRGFDDEELELDKQTKELKEKHAHYLSKMQVLQGKIAEVDKKLNGLKFTIIKDMELLPDEVKRVDEGDAEQLNESIREEADYVASQRAEVKAEPIDVDMEEQNEDQPDEDEGQRRRQSSGRGERDRDRPASRKATQDDGMEQRMALKPADLDKIRAMTIDDYQDLNVKLQQEEQKIAEIKKNVDFTVLDQYKERLAKYQKEVEVLREISKVYNEHNTRLDKFKTERTEEFMAGFVAISLAVREMYQMITMGGDASLEAKDTIDPFSEGIVFMVRPPNKSWKQIENLSGGEKTLSSLALVFALHHYRPTPLYVMDEIDAALDFRNVSIIGRYILNRTSNAQFIVISLRNNMFELAHRLVGIYKVNDCTENCAIDPAMINKKVQKYMSALVEAGIEARKDDFVSASQNLELEDIEPQNVSQNSNWEVTFEGEKEQQPASSQPKVQRKNTAAAAAAGRKRKNSSDRDESASPARPKKAKKPTTSKYRDEEEEDDAFEIEEEEEEEKRPARRGKQPTKQKMSDDEVKQRCRTRIDDTPFQEI